MWDSLKTLQCGRTLYDSLNICTVSEVLSGNSPTTLKFGQGALETRWRSSPAEGCGVMGTRTTSSMKCEKLIFESGRKKNSSRGMLLSVDSSSSD